MFTFAEKIIGLTNSQLVVRNNITSFMDLEINADTVADNIELNEQILENPHVDIEEANFNLNSNGGLQAQNIIPDISGTATVHYDLPRLLEEDLYRKKRSQIDEGGTDSADAGAIEVNFLNDSRSYTDPSEPSVATITPQGRNIMARAVMGQASAQIIGFGIGRAGYIYHNPVETLPIDTESNNARGWIDVANNVWTIADKIFIRSYIAWDIELRPRLASEVDDPINHIYYFDVGTSVDETADNIALAINDNDELIASVWCQVENNRVHLVSVPVGTIGNTIWYSIEGDSLISFYGVAPSQGTFTGGVDESINNCLIDPIFEAVSDGGEIFVEYADERALAITAKLGPTDVNYAIGEISILAEIKSSVFPGEVGTRFCFAVAHQPLSVKHSKMFWIKRMVIIL